MDLNSIKKIDKTDQNLILIDSNWSKWTKIRSKIDKTDQNLILIDQNWLKLINIHRNWSKFDENWIKLIEMDINSIKKIGKLTKIWS